LIELGLLAVIVAVMSASIYVMRRSQRFKPPDDETRLQDD